MGNAEQEHGSFSLHGWLWELLSLFIALSLAERCLDALHLACLLRHKVFALVEKRGFSSHLPLQTDPHWPGTGSLSSCLVISTFLI